MTTKAKIKGGSFLIESQDPFQIFTPEDFNEEHKMIARTALDFCLGEVAPHLEEIEEQKEGLTVRLLKKAGELGLLGADVPEEYGGLGLDKISSTLISEYLVHGGSFALSHGAHVGIGTLPIVFFGNRAQKEKYLPALATGEKIAAYALTEPTSGSDALGAKTTAVLNREGTHYILNGTKQFITNAGFADVFCVYAKVDGDKFTAFIVERDFPGVSTGPEEKKMGIKGSSTRQLILEDVPVPVENVLGEIGKGHRIAFNILNIGRYKLAAAAVGTSKIALELAVKYGNARKQFGTPITSFPLIQNKLADMLIRTFVAETMVYRITGLIEEATADLNTEAGDFGNQAADAIGEYALECSISKVFGSECLDFVTDEGVQIHGGYGFIQEYPIERLYRDSRINRIFEGTNEINRLLIPGTLLKKASKGDLPLLQAMQSLQAELANGTVPAGEGTTLGREKALLAQMKKVALWVAGLAVQKYQNQIQQEQEILAALADMIIDIYAAEGAVLRTEKWLHASGPDKAGLMVRMSRVYTQEAFERVEWNARRTLAALAEGESLGGYLSALQALTRYSPVNTVALKREIAARVIETEKYVVA
jgi:alkylation response protein AidB-like acyl-CoA dehydrogenase